MKRYSFSKFWFIQTHKKSLRLESLFFKKTEYFLPKIFFLFFFNVTPFEVSEKCMRKWFPKII